MGTEEALFNYVIGQADNCLILGQRLGEWCGHGPVLEQDIAMTNIALDLIGQSRSLYQYTAKVQGEGKTEDDLAYLRDVWQFKNVLLVEQPNQDFAYTIARQFYFDTFNYLFYQELVNSFNEQLRAIAQKSLKEVTYHLKWSSDWMLRLGDGTGESHVRIENATNDLWSFTGELFESNEVDIMMASANIGVDLSHIKTKWISKVSEITSQATLNMPEGKWMQSGGKEGKHSEHLGFILSDLQFLQRAYPGARW